MKKGPERVGIGCLGEPIGIELTSLDDLSHLVNLSIGPSY